MKYPKPFKQQRRRRDGVRIPMDEFHAFCSLSHSQPPSLPRAKVKGDANEDEYQKFQETELFEDTLVLHSPLIDTQVENLNPNTELVEDSDPEENMTTGTLCEYEQEVVLDSEDEEMHNSKAITVAKGSRDDETSPTVKNPMIGFQKRQLEPTCEQAADSNATNFEKSATGDKGASMDAGSFNDKNHLYLAARLNHIPSPEPGDLTQANALAFVDRYLSSNNVDLLQEIHYRKAIREKSPHVLSARGPLSLAKKIKAQTQNEEPFKWVDSDQNTKGAGIFCEKIEASSNFGSHRQTYVRRKKRGDHLQNQGNCCTVNRYREKLVQGPGMAAKNNNSTNELDVQSSATSENVNACSCVAHTEGLSDIGLDTQIAAEAMEALAYVPPPSCYFNDAHQPENALDGSFSNVTENGFHLQNSSYRENPALQSITIKSKKINVSSCSFSTVASSSSCKQTETQEPNPVSGKMKKMMKSNSTIEGQFQTNSSSCMNFQPAAKELKNLNNESRWTGINDQPSNHTERKNNFKEEGIIRQRRKGDGLVVDPLKLGVEAKRLKLPAGTCGVARKSRSNHQVQVTPQLSATSSFLGIDSWFYPKRPRGKRKRANFQVNPNAPTIMCIQSAAVYGKESNVHSTRSLEGKNDVNKSCLPHIHSLCRASCIDTGRHFLLGNSAQPSSAVDAKQLENLHDTQPLLLAHVEISSNKSIAQSSSDIPAIIGSSEGMKISNANHTYNESHRKPCNKNLPKSSLLKELIRLGVSKSRSHLIWKDLRQRKDMTFVRVLFSQHLDDSVIKQQKKILARLNISIASCPIDATHFVADKFTRTKNMLETMALGKLVVTHSWLESCGQANCFIDEKNYILRDVKKEKEIGFSMPVSLAQARQKPLLKGKRVYITPHIKPDKEVVSSLVTAVHGQVVDECQICTDENDKILDDLLILSCEDDYAVCHHFLERGAAVYSSELLLNGIIIQKLELERHQLFMNQVTGNNP